MFVSPRRSCSRYECQAQIGDNSASVMFNGQVNCMHLASRARTRATQQAAKPPLLSLPVDLALHLCMRSRSWPRKDRVTADTRAVSTATCRAWNTRAAIRARVLSAAPTESRGPLPCPHTRDPREYRRLCATCRCVCASTVTTMCSQSLTFSGLFLRRPHAWQAARTQNVPTRWSARCVEADVCIATGGVPSPSTDVRLTPAMPHHHLCLVCRS